MMKDRFRRFTDYELEIMKSSLWDYQKKHRDTLTDDELISETAKELYDEIQKEL